ncbi:hypothetical protein HanIR_Chr08g0342221 [Helianthus annuus]|nr:hypothetical protein HanIR_Chr08g0342221 [Helianthus annuus]
MSATTVSFSRPIELHVSTAGNNVFFILIMLKCQSLEEISFIYKYVFIVCHVKVNKGQFWWMITIYFLTLLVLVVVVVVFFHRVPRQILL